MTAIDAVVSAPIDDFLAGAGDASAAGERWEALGMGLALGGVVLAVGLVVFLGAVHTGRRSEVRTVLRLTMVAGVLALVGGVIEVAGTADVLGLRWSEALTDGSASSAMMRLLAGLLIVLGITEETVAVGGLAGTPGSIGEHGSLGTDADTVRWFPGASSAFGLAGVALGVLSFAFDGHTVAEGPRLVHALVNVAHVASGGVWFGGVVALFVISLLRYREGGASAARLVIGFSTVATLALGVVFVAGVLMAWWILDGPGELTSTPWGQRLLVKLVAVGMTMAIGAYNHFVVVPRLTPGDDAAAERMSRATVTAEAVLLTFVVVATVLLTRSSTN